jgi:NAD+ diphosphatase
MRGGSLPSFVLCATKSLMPLSAVLNTFAGNPLDRASERRGDAEWLDRLQREDPSTLCLPLWNGQPLTEKTADGKVQLAYVPGGMANELAGGWERLLFLGLWKETAVFAVDMEGAPDPTDGPLNGLGRFSDLRQVALTLPATEAAIAATAKGMFEWRRKHRYCSNCGEPSQVSDGGWKRSCPACRTEHFPRTDPVVIMLPVKGDKCLLGRQAIWPKGMFSALAGFLEPGESIEEACAREVKEEAGLTATAVRYHSTQPWPYPNSLMIGLMAEVDSEDARPDQTELEAVRWFTREEARQLVNGGYDGCFAPPPMAIAHQLLKSWAEEG